MRKLVPTIYYVVRKHSIRMLSKNTSVSLRHAAKMSENAKMSEGML